MKVVGIIASRYGSSRLPGKALKDICGYPMVWWVYQRVIAAHALDEIYVATDDVRVESVCKSYGIPVIMTKSTHREAANRLQEASEMNLSLIHRTLRLRYQKKYLKKLNMAPILLPRCPILLR